jgi:hypothetical protein
MKEFAANKHSKMSLAGVAAELLPDEAFDYNPSLPIKPFRGGLRAVSPLGDPPQPRPEGANETAVSEVAKPTLIRQVFLNRITPKRLTTSRSSLPILTTEEFIEVRLATVRESTRHCYWPADVVAKFLAAEVITKGTGQ